MAGRGAQTLKKRQKEQNRKERQEQKRARRALRRGATAAPGQVGAPEDVKLEPVENSPEVPVPEDVA